MRSKSHNEIGSVSQTLVQEAVDVVGPPDLIIESAEATFRGLPDLEADPRARKIMDRLWKAVDDLPILTTEDKASGHNGNGGSRD